MHEDYNYYDPSDYLNMHNVKLNGGAIDQEWSYSLNNSVYFSQNDQRLINEIIRQLKPIVKRSVKKQLKYYMERQMLKELKKSGFMLNTLDSEEFANIEEFWFQKIFKFFWLIFFMAVTNMGTANFADRIKLICESGFRVPKMRIVKIYP